MMRKKAFTTILCFLLFLSLAFSQKGNRRNEIIKKRVEYLIPRLDLTIEESQAFWPLYNEYQKKKSELSRTIGERFGDYKKEAPRTEEEYRKALAGMMENKIKQNELLTQYNIKYLEVLTPKKVYHLYQCEEQFNKFLLRQLKESTKGKQGKWDNP
ncbi:MAG: hypothetical protein Sapg2KO_27500 [Saprospiraceae bacterium]